MLQAPLPGGPTGDPIRDLAANAALLLLVGGLAMLFLIVILLLLQNLFPLPAQSAQAAPGTRVSWQLRPLQAPAPDPSLDGRPGRDRQGPQRPRIDAAMDQLVQTRVGEPRLLRHRVHYTHLRLYGCRSCSPQPRDAGLGQKVQGCNFERAAIDAAFQTVFRGGGVLVRESACRFKGHPECEYEVRH